MDGLSVLAVPGSPIRCPFLSPGSDGPHPRPRGTPDNCPATDRWVRKPPSISLCPGGASDNCPAIYRWVSRSSPFNRPSGTDLSKKSIDFPAINRWAILKRPYESNNLGLPRRDARQLPSDQFVAGSASPHPTLFAPEGPVTIAQRFIAGSAVSIHSFFVPEGRPNVNPTDIVIGRREMSGEHNARRTDRPHVRPRGRFSSAQIPSWRVPSPTSRFDACEPLFGRSRLTAHLYISPKTWRQELRQKNRSMSESFCPRPVPIPRMMDCLIEVVHSG